MVPLLFLLPPASRLWAPKSSACEHPACNTLAPELGGSATTIRHLGVTNLAHLLARRRRTTIIAAVLGLCYVALLVTLSMLSYPSETSVLTTGGEFIPDPGSISLIPGILPRQTGIRSLIWGTIFFVPVGIFAYLTLPRWAWPLSLLIGPVVTIMLQLIAWAAMPGHEADPLRWLCNVGGSALGVALAAAATWLTARPRVPSA